MNFGIFVSLPVQPFEITLVKRETKKTIICTSARNGSTGEQFEAVHPAVQKMLWFLLLPQISPGCRAQFRGQT